MERTIHLSLKNYHEFQILFENNDYAILFKPPNIPTAPLLENEAGTLLSLFLHKRSEAKKVCGAKKKIEHGLLHRLDTATSGLVLIAKEQNAYHKLCLLQEKNCITKTYFAFCDIRIDGILPDTILPVFIRSKFRAFGPGGKKVKAVFLDTNEAKKLKSKIYTSEIISLKKASSKRAEVSVAITKGYRHQIRAHLSAYHIPIIGDALYNAGTAHRRLQLYAIALSFPNIDKNSDEILTYKIEAPKHILDVSDE